MEKLELRAEVVAPGDLLARDISNGTYTYLDGGEVKASVFGLKDIKKDSVSVIPLAGKYMPKAGDMVIGVITMVDRNGWEISINSPYPVFLQRDRDMDPILNPRRLYKEGDIVSVKIKSVNEMKKCYAEGPRKLRGGRILMINAKKIPRVIGNRKSMLGILREKSECRVVVGQNGVIWLDGPERNVQMVVDAILQIERESHTKGLTDRISSVLDKKMKVIKEEENGRKK